MFKFIIMYNYVEAFILQACGAFVFILWENRKFFLQKEKVMLQLYALFAGRRAQRFVQGNVNGRIKKGIGVDTYGTLNEILVRLFRDILDLEQRAIVTPEFQDLTNNDMHVIEAIGMGEPKNMSSIARELSVTVGTLTIAMNSLVKKGYVVRNRGREDRRVVYISLSERGKAVYEHHARFHREMIDSMLNYLEEDEIKVLIKALNGLNSWFRGLEEK